MATPLTDIRDSALLELYVLGELAPVERARVEAAVRDYPELREDLAEIERALERYAVAQAIPPAPGVLEAALRATRGSGSGGGGGAAGRGPWAWGLGLLALALIGVGAYRWSGRAAIADELALARVELAECREARADEQGPIAIAEDLQRADNRAVAVTPTEGYPETSVLIYVNPATERNYLALAGLPSLGPDQAYQLWSLKPDLDPIPLDVFFADTGVLPVRFEPGTATYAITIEDAGGAASPDLDRLVGTFDVGASDIGG